MSDRITEHSLHARRVEFAAAVQEDAAKIVAYIAKMPATSESDQRQAAHWIKTYGLPRLAGRVEGLAREF